MPIIVISTDFVEEKAKEYGHSFNEEFSLLFIHGILHLLGFDHEVDEGEHRNKEEELIKEIIAKIDSIEPGLDIQVNGSERHNIDLNLNVNTSNHTKKQETEKIKKKKLKLSLNDEKSKLLKKRN